MKAGKSRSRADLWQRIEASLASPVIAVPDDPKVREKSLRTLWKRRAEELSRPAEVREEGLLWDKVILIKVGKESYAFRVEDVEEIMRVTPITPVPCVPEHFSGVVNRRGNILPLVDLKVFFRGEKSGGVTNESRIIVLSRQSLCLGFLVEAADKILNLPPDSIKPPLRKGDGLHEEFCAGVITLGKRMIVLIDSVRLLEDDRMKVDKGV